MRLSNALFKTQRNAPSDAQLISHRLLARTGLVRQLASGIYSLSPLALRALQKILQIAREEMLSVGGQEVLLPVAQPASLWEQSGRYETIDASLARWRDRNHQNMVLAMTHEEAVTDLIRQFVHSYRQLPLMVFQIQTKFRDEPRPRGGLVRLREFMMKDAYSFHTEVAGLDEFYEEMMAAYDRFFERCGVGVLRVEADTGMMGGGMSHEYMVLSDGGEDTLIICRQCGYAANREVAVAADGREVDTAGPTWKLYQDGEGNYYVAGIPNGRQVNEIKLARALGVAEVRETPIHDTQDFERIGNEWLHELGILKQQNVAIVLDPSLALQPKSQLPAHQLADIMTVQPGDKCSHCGSTLEAVRGIEAGNTFKLGTQYSAPMQANVTTREGTTKPMVMGCYGIGITRMLACVIEANHDERGIVFPESIAPYRYHLIRIGTDLNIEQAADSVYRQLGPEHVLYDDRDVTAGVKFTDADLLGLPFRLTVSKKSLSAESVELSSRRTGRSHLIPIADLSTLLPSTIQAVLA